MRKLLTISLALLLASPEDHQVNAVSLKETESLWSTDGVALSSEKKKHKKHKHKKSEKKAAKADEKQLVLSEE